MSFSQSFKQGLFELKASDFESRSLELFQYQAQHNTVYRSYLDALKVDARKITRIESIPFLPISFFKQHKVICGEWEPEAVFESSGTTGQVRSKNYVEDLAYYDKISEQIFNRFYGSLEEYTFFALLPSYLERNNSSLVYMMNHFIEKSNSPYSGFYLNNYEELLENIQKARQEGHTKIVLIGVTFALLELAESFSPDLSGIIVMETGGMKGRREEMVRPELHAYLKKTLNLNEVHAEYGMTELMSQAYSKGDGIFECPPWMRVLIRDLNDPYCVGKELRQGGVNVIDLANVHSCAFIETQDIGRKQGNCTFEILGRFDNSDVRGCNLLVI